jgi:hypothetical protein
MQDLKELFDHPQDVIAADHLIAGTALPFSVSCLGPFVEPTVALAPINNQGPF